MLRQIYFPEKYRSGLITYSANIYALPLSIPGQSVSHVDLLIGITNYWLRGRLSQIGLDSMINQSGFAIRWCCLHRLLRSPAYNCDFSGELYGEKGKSVIQLPWQMFVGIDTSQTHGKFLNDSHLKPRPKFGNKF